MRLFCKPKKVYALNGRILIVFVLLFSILAIFLFIYNTCYSGTIKEKARVRANYVAISAINKATEELLSESQFDEKSFIVTGSKTDGTISSVTLNAKTTNLFKAKLSQKILDTIKNYDKEIIEMAPLSSYGFYFVPFGIRVPVYVVPIEILSTDFRSALTESGINQTLYKLCVDVKISVKLLLPVGSETFEVKTTVPLVQTVIVGDIPDSYTNVEGAEDTGPNTILDIAS